VIITVPLKRAAPDLLSVLGNACPQLAQVAESGATAFPHSGQNAMLERLRPRLAHRCTWRRRASFQKNCIALGSSREEAARAAHSHTVSYAPEKMCVSRPRAP